MESINFADSLNQCLVLLEWSTEDLEREMRYKYSLDHLMRVREGKAVFLRLSRTLWRPLLEHVLTKSKTAVSRCQITPESGRRSTSRVCSCR